MILGDHIRIKEMLVDHRTWDNIVIDNSTLMLINYRERTLELRKQSDRTYPLESFVTFPAFTAKASAYDYFEEYSIKPDGTGINYQVSIDGLNWLYWTGAAWAAAGPTDWNSEAEICANLYALVPSTSILYIRVQLISDGTGTPVFQGFSLSYLTRIDPVDDFFYRSLIPYLRDVQAWFVLEHVMQSTSDQIIVGDLDDLKYEIDGIIGAYNLTDDPNRINDIALSWNPGTRVVTMTSPQDAGDIIEVRFSFKPDATLQTGVDYIETNGAPAYIIDSAEMINTYHNLGAGTRNKAGKKARIYDMIQSDWLVTLIILAGRSTDLVRMVNALVKKIYESPLLHSSNFDEDYDLVIVTEPTINNMAGIKDIRDARLAFHVKAVPLPFEAVEKPLVTQTDFTVYESREV